MQLWEKLETIRAFKLAQKIILKERAKARSRWPRLAAVLQYIASDIIPREIERVKRRFNRPQ